MKIYHTTVTQPKGFRGAFISSVDWRWYINRHTQGVVKGPFETEDQAKKSVGMKG